MQVQGHKNDNLLIRASFSPGAEFIVCGSEDENVYVWSTINSFVPSINPIYTGYRRDKHSSYESFAAQSDISTVALLAPEEVRRAKRAEPPRPPKWPPREHPSRRTFKPRPPPRRTRVRPSVP